MVILPTEKHIDWRRPPVVLIALVLLNLIVFFAYQSQDITRLQKAVEAYQQFELLEIERPAWDAYRLQNPDLYGTEELPGDDESLSYGPVMDPQFKTFIDEQSDTYIAIEKREYWKRSRAEVEFLVSRISYQAYGLIPKNISLITVFTHQFLHGGIMHLIGNMVFLLLVGFAVEAALGSKRFLLYYLVSGVFSGAAYAAYQMVIGEGEISLVGASGAISGVMAMYLALFRLRKIEFFYWFFIFTGYFRAAAIVILPAYILKELYFLYFTEGSNVAYMAHIAGFVAGAVLILVTQHLQAEVIDTDYLDGKEEVQDPYLVGLQGLYQQIGRCNFRQAWKLLQQLHQSFGKRPELKEIEYNLLRILSPDKADELLLDQFGRAANEPIILAGQVDKWRSMSADERLDLSFHRKLAFANSLLNSDYLQVCDELFTDLKKTECPAPELAELAQRLAMHFRRYNRPEKADRYARQAADLNAQGSAQAGQLI